MRGHGLFFRPMVIERARARADRGDSFSPENAGGAEASGRGELSQVVEEIGFVDESAIAVWFSLSWGPQLSPKALAFGGESRRIHATSMSDPRVALAVMRDIQRQGRARWKKARRRFEAPGMQRTRWVPRYRREVATTLPGSEQASLGVFSGIDAGLYRPLRSVEAGEQALHAHRTLGEFFGEGA